jgi:hypothetical protein
MGNMNIGDNARAWWFPTGSANVELDHLYCYDVGMASDGFLNVMTSSGATWDNIRLHHNTLYLPKIASAYGADGFSGAGDGISIYNNYVVGYIAPYTGSQHQDGVQILAGNYIKDYNNTFIALGMSGSYFELTGSFGDCSFNHVRIYNNICINCGCFGIEVESESGGTQTFTDVVVANNTVEGVNAGYTSIAMFNNGSTTYFNNCVFANNATLFCANRVDSPITSVGNVSVAQSAGTTCFASYTPNGTNNDYHLISTATTLIGKGSNLYATYPELLYDKDGYARSTSAAWDVGAYRYGAASTNPVVSVTPSNQSFGSVVTNTVKDLSFVVKNTGAGTLAGTATVSAPFSIVSGASYSLAAGQSQSVTVRFSPVALTTSTANVTFPGGGGALGAVSGTGTTNMPPQVSAISSSSADVDSALAGLQVYAGSVVQYSASASSPSGSALTWRWTYSVNGGADTLFLSGTGAVTSISYNYVPSTAGSTYIWKLAVSDGHYSTTSSLTCGVEAPPAAGPGMVLDASSGVITAPFSLASGAVSQPTDTDALTGGMATYTFNVTNAGNYVVQLFVNATDLAANSVFVNIDAPVQDPTTIFDIPLTAGFEQRIVSWRGNGTPDANQFVPKWFTLSVGLHQLVIVGREAGVQFQQISILLVPPPPLNLRVVSSQ